MHVSKRDHIQPTTEVVEQSREGTENAFLTSLTVPIDTSAHLSKSALATDEGMRVEVIGGVPSHTPADKSTIDV